MRPVVLSGKYLMLLGRLMDEAGITVDKAEGSFGYWLNDFKSRLDEIARLKGQTVPQAFPSYHEFIKEEIRIVYDDVR